MYIQVNEISEHKVLELAEVPYDQTRGMWKRQNRLNGPIKVYRSLMHMIALAFVSLGIPGDNKSSDVRVIAIGALTKLGAKEALPRLRALLDDEEKSYYGEQVSVAQAARKAIAKLEEH